MKTTVYELQKPESIKSRKRVGRGTSSGCGKTSSRGHNGQLSRSGSKKRVWFEGGQMPLQRRVPKRGFNNFTRKEYIIINLSFLAKLDAGEVTPSLLLEKGVISSESEKFKILGNGDISKAVKVTADAFSKTAEEKIKKNGGEIAVRK